MVLVGVLVPPSWKEIVFWAVALVGPLLLVPMRSLLAEWQLKRHLKKYPRVTLIREPKKRSVSRRSSVKPLQRAVADHLFKAAVFSWGLMVSAVLTIGGIVASVLLAVKDDFMSVAAASASKERPEPSKGGTSSPKPRSDVPVPPTSVLKVPGTSRKQRQHTVNFSEDVDGSLKTAYYYFNPSLQPRHSPLQATNLAAPFRASKPYRKTPVPSKPANDKENQSASYRTSVVMTHSPGIKEIQNRRQLSQLSEPLGRRWQKRDLELWDDPSVPTKRSCQRPSLTPFRSSAPKRVLPDRQEHILKEMNRKRIKVPAPTASNAPVAATTPGPAKTGGDEKAPSAFSFGQAAPSTAAATENPTTGDASTLAPAAVSKNNPSVEAASFQFGSAAETSNATIVGNPSFQLSSAASATPTTESANAPGAPQLGANPAASAAPNQTSTPSFSFGSTSANTPAPGPVNPPPVQFGADPKNPTLPSAVNAPPMQFGAPPVNVPASTNAPSFNFGSTAANTPAPGPVAAPSFQFGSTTANTPAAGTVVNLATAPMPAFAPTATTLPGAVALGGVPASSNQGASARRRAARGRKGRR